MWAAIFEYLVNSFQPYSPREIPAVPQMSRECHLQRVRLKPPDFIYLLLTQSFLNLGHWTSGWSDICNCLSYMKTVDFQTYEDYVLCPKLDECQSTGSHFGLGAHRQANHFEANESNSIGPILRRIQVNSIYVTGPCPCSL